MFAHSCGHVQKAVVARLSLASQQASERDVRSRNDEPHYADLRDFDAAVVRVDEFAESALRRLLDALPPQMPVVLQARVSRPIVRSASPICGLTRRGVYVSLEGVDQLEHDICRAITGGHLVSPELQLWRTLRNFSPLDSDTPELAFAFAMLGRRRLQVSELARQLGVSLRTLELRVQERSWPRSSVVLGFALRLHASWQAAILKYSSKQGATQCGFSSASSFRRYLARHRALSADSGSVTSEFIVRMTALCELLEET